MVEAIKRVSAKFVEVVVAIALLSLQMTYPPTAMLSVEGFQDRSISDCETGMAFRLVGTDGGVVSTPVVVTDSVNWLDTD